MDDPMMIPVLDHFGSSKRHNTTFLVGGLEHDFFDFLNIGNFMIPTDFHIFQRGRYTTNQILHRFTLFIVS